MAVQVTLPKGMVFVLLNVTMLSTFVIVLKSSLSIMQFHSLFGRGVAVFFFFLGAGGRRREAERGKGKSGENA